MPSSFDRFLPRIKLAFPDGAVLSVGTVSCDDQIHQAVYLGYTPPDSPTPVMELELPPKSVDLIIGQLQDYANQARFVNGEPMLEYPTPHPYSADNASHSAQKSKHKKTP